MQIPTAQDIQNVINGMPAGTPNNNPALQQLYQMLANARVQLQPYHFPLTFVVAAGVTSAPQQIQIDASAPFMLVSQEYFCSVSPVVAVTTIQQANLSVQIVDQQSNRQWQSAAVPVDTIFGTGRQPYFYPQPRLIAANTSLQVTVNNFDTAQTYSLTLTFSGYRYYAA